MQQLPPDGLVSSKDGGVTTGETDGKTSTCVDLFAYASRVLSDFDQR